ncbi:diguanylate cyclase [Gallaecimonas pentaromativorans]|uniref:GGDEF domain-containing protein n=1 Tax=Gallaecimonas pentaromativorans TaxID=584787 RepID=UPI003A92BEA8
MNAPEIVFVLMLSVSTMLGIIFLLSWRTIERRTYCLVWSILFWVSVLNVLLNVFHTGFGHRDLYWIVVNATSLVMQALSLAGFRLRAGKIGFPTGLVAPLAAVELVLVWFTLIQPHVGLKMVLIPCSGAVIGLCCAYQLLTPKHKVRPVEKALALMFVIYAIAQAASGLVALSQGRELVPDILEVYRLINFLAMPAAFTGLGLFTVLLLADDLAERMRALATTDSLTGLLNRRGFEEAANRRLALPLDTPLFAVMADIDHFKTINDQYGHGVGDLALKSFARQLNRNARSTDILGRFGGEEFALLLEAASAEQALEIVERLRQKAEAHVIKTPRGPIKLTVSFGLTSVASPQTLSAVLRQADAALYQAKSQGRNQTQAFDALAQSA